MQSNLYDTEHSEYDEGIALTRPTENNWKQLKTRGCSAIYKYE